MKFTSQILVLISVILCAELLSISGALANSIELDGELEELAWKSGFKTENFKVSEPLSFDTPPNKTQVFVTSDKDGIYVGFINYQFEGESPDSRSLRDAQINTDFNQVIIDFDGQGVRAFGSKVSRTGSIQDSIWSDENRESADWDGEWQYAVEEDEEYWSSELFIPWSIVSMSASEGKTRRIKLYLSRWHQGKSMQFSYPPIDDDQKSFISKFEALELAFSESASLDWFPYVSYNKDLENKKSETRGGIDIFWRPSSAQQINLTINPDFGQVESDDLVVNFSAVETFFSEKRPFFRENHDLFDLQGPENLRLVHTPRIGGESDVEGAPANDIDLAARYNFIGESFDFGILTASEDDSSFVRGRDYFATRVHYKNDATRIGFSQTFAERPSLNREASVSVVDFQIEPLHEIRLTGQFIRSDIEISQISTADEGWWLGAEWEPSDELSHEVFYFDFGQFLDVSDFGFVERVNRQQWNYEGSYQWTEFESSVRDLELAWYLETKDNTQNHDLPDYFAVNVIASFNSTREIEFEYEHQTAGIDDLITRGNNPVRFPKFDKLSFNYTSQQNSDFTYEIGLAAGNDFLDGKLTEIEFEPSWQITKNIELSFNFEYEQADSWVIWDEGNELEEFKRDEFTIAVNFNTVFAEKHELRLKLESVALEARAVNEYSADVFGHLSINDESPDSFSISEFAAQIRYRYEIGALSELFIVYSRGGEFEDERLGYSTFSLLNRAVNRDDDENFVVKLKMHF